LLSSGLKKEKNMKKLIILMTTVMILATTAGMALALTNTIDFEDQTPALDLVEIVYPDVTFTYSNSLSKLQTYDSFPGLGPPLAGITVTTSYGDDAWFVATFGPTVSVNQVQVDMGDTGGDHDTLFLHAYDKNDNLLTSDTEEIASGSNIGVTLSVTSGTPIAYVKFNETADFVGSIFFDNFTYGYEPVNPVPVPPSLLLLGTGLLGLAGWRRLRKV
jgi:hypothetical protein